jgi:hypothetical protein
MPLKRRRTIRLARKSKTTNRSKKRKTITRKSKTVGNGSRRSKRMRGGNFKDWVRGAVGKVKNFATGVHNYVKENKLISRGLSKVAPFLGAYAPIAGTAASISGALGYGRKPRHRRRRRVVGARKRIAGVRRRVVRRRMRGGRGIELGENNINALKENNINAMKENNINARHLQTGQINLVIDKILAAAKPPLQPLGQIVQPVNYPNTGKVPLFDRVRGYLKRTRVISRTARTLGANRIADLAAHHGYGKRRRISRRRQRGGALRDKYGQYLYVPKD